MSRFTELRDKAIAKVNEQPRIVVLAAGMVVGLCIGLLF